MLELLDVVAFLGGDTDLGTRSTLIWLLVIQIIFVIIAISLIIYLSLRKGTDRQSAVMTVAQHDPVPPLEEESYKSVLRYDRSFIARLVQSEDEIKYRYTELKNRLLSYKSVHARISWKKETFRSHGDVVAMLAFRGKTLCLYLPLVPSDYMDEYPVEDESDRVTYLEAPLMLRLRSNRRVRLAERLIDTVMQQRGLMSVQREPIDYYLPYQGTLELINEGLVKRVVKTPEQEVFFNKEDNL